MAAAKLQMKNLLKPLYIICEEIDSSKYAFYEAEKKQSAKFVLISEIFKTDYSRFFVIFAPNKYYAPNKH